jgi:predicted nucleotidyltransferase component of viral defense system
MKNATQLKALAKNLAKEKKISVQSIMQNYMLERLLERISISPYKSNLILKGGLLISAIIGIDNRATMDMDTTYRGLAVNAQQIVKVFEEISNISVNDNISFSIKRVEVIKEHTDSIGFRLSLVALYPPMAVPLKIDITTGDMITPQEVIYEYKLLFEPRSIEVFAYNLETLIAEKIETVISRGDQNTRPRDFYDIYIIRQLQWQNINTKHLRAALLATAKQRNTQPLVDDYDDILKIITKSETMKNFWLRYQEQNNYAKEIEFKDICGNIREILGSIMY